VTAKGERRRRRALAAYALLQRAAELAAARVEAAVHPHGVSSAQCAVLEALAAHGAQHQQELATRLARSKAQLAALAEALEGKGLVHRERHPTDRRYMTVTLTDAGRALLAAVEPARAEAITALMAQLAPKARSRLAKGCRRLVQALGPDGGGGVDGDVLPAASAPTLRETAETAGAPAAVDRKPSGAGAAAP
jgi:MarR family 2-MHQ and catechol resistance regulon transcriptional repressor